MERTGPAIGGAPSHWFVCFCERTDTWWVRWLALGRYRHVRAFGVVPGSKLWIFVDVNQAGLAVKAATDDAAQELISAWTADAEAVLHVAARPARGLPRWPVFSCVTAVRHLTGCGGGALRPDRLWRDLLASGAKILDEERSAASPDPAARPCA